MIKLIYPKYKMYKFSDKKWGTNKVYKDHCYIYFSNLEHKLRLT